MIALSVFSNVYLLNTRNILILDSEVIGLSMNTQEGIILHTDTRTDMAVNIVSEWLLFKVKLSNLSSNIMARTSYILRRC